MNNSQSALSSAQALENTLFFVLLQLVVIILVARATGELARRMGQPRAVGEIVAGLALGPSLFGYFCPALSHYLFQSVPSLPLGIVSQLGLILLMFQIGMDFDFTHLRSRRNSRAVSLIAIVGIALPFALGFFLGKISAPFLAPDVAALPYSLFVATALSITAVPVLGRILEEYELTRMPVGVIAISAAALNDVVGWLLLALIMAFTSAQFSPLTTLAQLGWLVLYLGVCVFAVRPLLRRLLADSRFQQQRIPGNLMAVVLALIFASGIATYRIGIFASFGGFMMGVIVHDMPRFVALWKKTIGDFVTVFFLPVFFTYTGMRTNIAGLDSPALWGWCLIILVAAVLGKAGGGYLGARFAGLDKYEAGTIGILMNTRGLVELIVLNIGFDAGFIPPDVFTILVIMAVVTTVMTGPGLHSMLPKMGRAAPALRPPL